jgi:hypothetical protein
MRDFNPKTDFLYMDTVEDPIHFPSFNFPLTQLEWEVMMEDFINNFGRTPKYSIAENIHAKTLYP